MKNKSRKNTYCHILWDEIYIEWDGNVFACCRHKPHLLGNIYQSDLKDMFNGENMKKFRRESLDGQLECYDARCTYLNKDETAPPEKSPIGDYSKLKKIRISFGELCNIQCTMCPQDHRNRKTLDYQELIDHVDISYFEEIKLQGGEPLIIQDAKEYFDYVVSKGKKPSFFTNGLVMNEEWVNKIALYSGYIKFSINAATQKTHEIVNKGSNWETVLRNIQRVRKAREIHGTNLVIWGHMTIVPENLKEIPLFIKKHRDLGFEAIDFGFSSKIPGYLRRHFFEKALLKIRVRNALRSVGRDSVIDSLRLRLLGLV